MLAFERRKMDRVVLLPFLTLGYLRRCLEFLLVTEGFLELGEGLPSIYLVVGIPLKDLVGFPCLY